MKARSFHGDQALTLDEVIARLVSGHMDLTVFSGWYYGRTRKFLPKLHSIGASVRNFRSIDIHDEARFRQWLSRDIANLDEIWDAAVVAGAMRRSVQTS